MPNEIADQRLSLPQCVERLERLSLRIKGLQTLMERACQAQPSDDNEQFLKDIRQGRLEIWDCLQLSKEVPESRQNEVLNSMRGIVSVWETMLAQIDAYLDGNLRDLGEGASTH